MPAKKPTSSGSSRSRVSATSIIVVVVVLACLAAVYMFTGADPFKLFNATQPAETAAVQNTASPTAQKTRPPAAPTKISPPVPSSGDWWQVYFTDPTKIKDPNNLAGSLEEKLIAHINAAKKSIHIAAFEFNLTPVADALIAASKRGVDVKWITDDENGLAVDGDPGRGQFAMLKKAKIPIIDDKRSALMHDKYWIFDSQTLWTGSTNVTVNDVFRNNNNSIVFDVPEIAAIYEREFADMWAGNFGPDSPSTIDQQSVTVDGTPIQILFSPEDHVIDKIIPLVKAAKKSVYFMIFTYTHDGLMNAMIERFKAGVTVQGIIETRGSETEYSALPPMFCAKMSVRQDGNPGTFHHKVIVIDEKILITGSLNFTANADEGNSENTVILTNPQIAALYLQEFQRRWAEAKDPDPSSMKCK